MSAMIDVAFYTGNSAFSQNAAERALHRGDGGANGVVAADDEADFAQSRDVVERQLRVARRHQDQRRVTRPGSAKGQDFVWRLLLAVNQHTIRAGFCISLAASERLVLAETGASCTSPIARIVSRWTSIERILASGTA
jgi:hypothetical protein